MSLFANVALAPRDPILGLNEQFNADSRSTKVNLGVGVYYDEHGKLPLLNCVREAEAAMAAAPKPRGYLPIDGILAYDRAVQALVFGSLLPQIATVQALGGTGAIKIGADFLKHLSPSARVLISDPSWENHRALFTQAGFAVDTYPYYDAERRGIAFDAMLASLKAAAPGSIVVLHACCHNPSGYDLSPAQWTAVVATCAAGGLTPFLDMAYQGFGLGLHEDGEAVRQFLESGIAFFVSTSFSKSFSLYGERVGALSVVCGSADETARVLSQLKIMIRTNYSNPPTHGGQIVAQVLADARLRALWEAELGGMRTRIKAMRVALVSALKAAGVAQDLTFVTDQLGMFSYSGLNAAQMQRLRSEFAVYGLDSGRICVAALNESNLPAVAAAMAAVMQG